MIGTLTFTGSIGPGNALTTKLFSNVTKLIIDYTAVVLTVVWSDGQGEHTTDLDFYDIDTLTASVVEAVSAAITIST